MTLELEATFDGKIFRPASEFELKLNTKVKLTVEPEEIEIGKPYSFLNYAKSLKLEGPSDFSSRIDFYLYEIEGDE